MKPTERDLDVLGDLAVAVRNYRDIGAGDWVRPMDCGGTNGSTHSYRLGRLAKMGLAERKKIYGFSSTGSRGSCKYTITAAGLKELADLEAARSAAKALTSDPQ